MKYFTSTLSRQLLSLIVIIFAIILVSIGVLLPGSLKPIYEKNLYNYLEQPLDFVNENISSMDESEIAYVYKYNDKVAVSDNFYDVINVDKLEDLSKYLNNPYGKFYYKGKIYYYYKNVNSTNGTRIALTDDSYIQEAKKDTLYRVFPIIILTLSLTLMIIIICIVMNVLKVLFFILF